MCNKRLAQWMKVDWPKQSRRELGLSVSLKI